MTHKEYPENLTIIKTQDEEGSMSHRSRRGFLLSLVIPFTITAAAAGCTKATESQKVADQFMDIYYVQISVKDALPLSSGLAKEKLNGQLQLMQGAGPEPAADKPRVTWGLIASKTEEKATEATYVYKVDAHVEDVGKRLVYVKLRKEGGKWLVTQFMEDDAPPSS